jgi:hypothetical protein
VGREGLLVERGRRDAPVPQDPAGRVHDLGPAAVVEGDDQGHPAVLPGQGFDALDLPEHERGDALAAADDPETDIVPDEEAVLSSPGEAAKAG